MEIASHYLIFAAEVFITTLGLLIALIYFYIRSDNRWQRLVHDIQDELLKFRKKYRDEKERADTIRALLHDKNMALEKIEHELLEVKKGEKALLTEIARLKEEIKNLHQSEKLRSEIVNQLITSKIQNEKLTAALEASQKAAETSHQQIHELEQEIHAHQPADATSSGENSESTYNLHTTGEIELEQLKAKTDKQVETIRELELELMRVGYKKPSEQAAQNEVTSEPKTTQGLEHKLNESETCVRLLENELSELQNKIRMLENEDQINLDNPQSNHDIQRLEQMLKESETCNTLLENELDSLMQKMRILEGKEEPPSQHYDI